MLLCQMRRGKKQMRQGQKRVAQGLWSFVKSIGSHLLPVANGGARKPPAPALPGSQGLLRRLLQPSSTLFSASMKTVFFRCLALMSVLATPALAQPTISTVLPVPNASRVAPATNVAVTFSQTLGAASVSALRVFSAQAGGRKAGTTLVQGAVLTFNPTTSFRAGETVQATVRTTAENTSGVNLAAPRVPAATGAAALKVPSPPLADVTGDGNPDFVVSSMLNG